MVGEAIIIHVRIWEGGIIRGFVPWSVGSLQSSGEANLDLMRPA